MAIVVGPAALAAVIGVVLVAVSDERQTPAAADDRCRETIGPAPGASPLPVELAPNAKRPTFEIAFEDHDDIEDDITFATAEDSKLLDPGANVTAHVVEFPRRGAQRLQAELDVEAEVDETRRRIRVEACLHRGDAFGDEFAAGRYEGIVEVYGADVEPFSSSLVVTQKWPWWSAAAILGVVLYVFVVLSGLRELLNSSRGRPQLVATIVGNLFAVGAGILTYATVYWQDNVWGEEHFADGGKLAIAAFTAAAGGLAVAYRLIGNGNGDGDDRRGAVPDKGEPVSPRT